MSLNDKNTAASKQQRERDQQSGHGQSVIAAHLIFMLYGHWAVNDPRGSGSLDFYDDKYKPLNPIFHGRKPKHMQPSRNELRDFHREHGKLLNFDTIWIDDTKRQVIANAVDMVIRERRYTCYACAICANHLHLNIRTHRDRAVVMWDHIADRIRTRLRLRFPNEMSVHHPVISARPYKVYLRSADDVCRCIEYIELNPIKEQLGRQDWDFVTRYDGWPHHYKNTGSSR